MKVVFVYPDLSLGSRGKFYHGVAFLSSALKKAGHQTSLIHILAPISEERFVDQTLQECPDLVAFSSTTNMFSYVKKYALTLRNASHILTICGGTHPTLMPEEVISCDGIDMVCVGEGEEALVELCDKLQNGRDICHIQNIWVKKNGGVYKNPVRPLNENLDSIAFPDRDIFNYEILQDSALKREVFMASRGCPYDCSYCCNYEFRKAYSGKYVRFRSVDNLLQEIEMVVGCRELDHIVFHDDLFTLNKKWLAEFSSKYPKKVGLPFICNSRIDILDESRVKMLRDAGSRMVELGIESGNPQIRENVLGRHMSNTQIIDTIALCKKYGLSVLSYNMVGLPFEDMGNILETIKLNAIINPHAIQVSIFYPYPRTKLYEVCRENNFLLQESLDTYFMDTILRQLTISRDQVVYSFRNFTILVRLYAAIYRWPGQISRIFSRILDRLFCSMNPLISIINKPHFVSGIEYYARYGFFQTTRKVLLYLLNKRWKNRKDAKLAEKKSF